MFGSKVLGIGLGVWDIVSCGKRETLTLHTMSFFFVAKNVDAVVAKRLKASQEIVAVAD